MPPTAISSTAHKNRGDPRRHPVVIVGAGFGGLTVAATLKDSGIHDFVILEEGDDVGGVWRENTYPGCACDVPSHLYSFEFDPHRDARVRYPRQPEILAYMQNVADRHGLREHLRTTTAVTAADYDDSTGTWTLTTTNSEHLSARAVIWAVGQLHRPATPSILGLSTFGGRAFHSARWDHTADLTGHLAVIGTGSSGTQIVPELARTAASVTVYQRTPAWILPRPREHFGPVSRWALEHIPGLHQLYRASLHRAADLTLAPIMHGGWSARPATWAARAHLRRQVSDPVLRAKLTPHYRLGEKRILLDSKFYPALRMPHVELVADPIERITVDGIRTTGGTHRPADVIVLATGFKAPEFLGGITIRGRGGADLHRQWARTGRPEAYLGLAVPGFPQMFMIAGPHSFTPAHSNPAIKASQARYIARCLEHSTALGAPLQVSASAMAAYRRWLDDALARTVWPDGVASWFKQSDGAITNPWPTSVQQFDRMTRRGPEHAFVPVHISQTAAVTSRRSA